MTNENVRSYDLIILAAGGKMAINEFKVAQTFKKYYGNVIKKRVADAPKFKVILKIRRNIMKQFNPIFIITRTSQVSWK